MSKDVFTNKEQLCQSFWQSVKEQKLKAKNLKSNPPPPPHKASRVNFGRKLFPYNSCVIRYCLLPTVCSRPRPMEIFFYGISCVVAMNIFGILQTCVKDIWQCVRVPMISKFRRMEFENVFYVKNLKKIY